MKNLSDIVGTELFPYQTEIAFVTTTFNTVRRLAISAEGHICQKQYWSACLCILLLVVYVGLAAAVVWAVIPWFKAFIVSKFALSPLWAAPVKSGLIWGIGKMVAAIRRKFTLSK